MADKEIILRGLENLKTKMNNASGGLFQRLENLEVENGKLKQKNKKFNINGRICLQNGGNNANTRIR